MRANSNIGFLHNNGLGVKQDSEEAATWYRVAAEHGDVKAEVYLGQLCQQGRGVSQSYAEAMAWYTRAADQGDSEAQQDIGYLYEHGLGVTPDYAKAMTGIAGRQIRTTRRRTPASHRCIRKASECHKISPKRKRGIGKLPATY